MYNNDLFYHTKIRTKTTLNNPFREIQIDLKTILMFLFFLINLKHLNIRIILIF